MIKAVQCVGWSLLDPQRVDLDPHGVCALIGQNGAGKSSLMDAIKALCGARRFGQGRTAGSYRFAGRGGEASVRRAYVLGLFDNSDKRLAGRGSEVTVVLEAGERQRRFLLLDGDRLLDGGPDTYLNALEELRRQQPRSAWLRPGDYARRVLEPLGIGPALRRFFEISQGEVARALDRDPQALIALLVELSGGREAEARFQSAGEALAQAKEALREARRSRDRTRAELAEERLAAAAAQQVLARRSRLATIAGEIERLLSATPQQRQRQRSGRLGLGALRRAGLDLVDDRGVWAVREQDRALAAEVLGPGEALPVVGADHTDLVCGPPAEELDADDEGPTLSGSERRRLRAALAEIERAGIEPAPAPIETAGRSAGELLGAFGELAGAGVPAAPRRKSRVDELEQRLAAEESEIARRTQLLEQATQRLAEARDLYERSTTQLLRSAATEFAELCRLAGMRGELEILPGPRCVIRAAEGPEDPLRELHGSRASLSGGWRATVVMLCVLACLTGEGAAPILLVDEVGSSLDEERLAVLGRAFASLAERRGLQSLITVPSKAVSQTVSEFATQQLAFFRPLPGEALAPPPHRVRAPRRRRHLRAA